MSRTRPEDRTPGRIPAPFDLPRGTAPAASATRPGGRIADIEVLRAFAILLVLYDHMPVNLVYWNSRSLHAVFGYLRGWVGVDLFFAISGFVIARTLLPALARAADDAAFLVETVRFWIRRAWRLLPSAWLWLLIPVGLCLASNRSGAFMPFRTNFDALVAGMLNVANIRLGMVYGGPQGVAFPYWSLSLEEQFYLVLPVAAFLFRRRLGIPLAVPLALLALLQFALPRTLTAMSLRPGALSLGVLLALWQPLWSWRLVEPTGLRRPWVRAAAVGVPLLFMAALGSDDAAIVTFRVGMIALLAGGLVWLASYDRGYVWPGGALRRPMLWIAARSYSIYLIHMPVFLGMHEAWYRSHPDGPDPHGLRAVPYGLAGLALVVGLADLNHRLVETRLRRRGTAIAARFGAAGPCGRV